MPSDLETLRRELDAANAAAQQAFQDTTRLTRVLTTLSEPLPPARLVDETLACLSELFAAEVTCILVEGDPGELRPVGICGLGEAYDAAATVWPAAAVPLDLHGGGSAVRGRPEDVPAAFAAVGVRTAAWVPLRSENDAVGVLALFRCRDDPFEANDIPILTAIGHRIGSVLEHSRRTRQIELLAQLGARTSALVDVDAVVGGAVGPLAELLEADACAVVLRGDDGAAVVQAQHGLDRHGAAAWRPPVETLAAWQAAVRGEPYLPGGAPTGETPATEAAGALLAVPLASGGATFGLLYFLRSGPRRFTHRDTDVAQLCAAGLARSIETARFHQALQRSEAELKLIAGAVRDLIAVFSADGVYTYASPSHEDSVGHAAGALLGRRVDSLVHPDERGALADALRRIAGGSSGEVVEHRYLDANGGWVWLETSLSRLTGSDDGRIVASSRIISERKALEAQLTHRAHHDELTGLPNRRLLLRHLDEALRRYRLGGPRPAVLFLDLDGFKEVNDTVGHEGGDRLLVAAAQRLGAVLRGSDILARLGGDEFVAVLGETRSEADATGVARRILALLEEPLLIDGHALRVSASVGVVLPRTPADTSGELLRLADAAMYRAKASRGGCYQLVAQPPTAA